jgi:predicted nucleic acid-binding protein
MLTLVDSSAWIEFIRLKGAPSAKAAVERLLASRSVACAPPIRYELAKGARTARELEYVEMTMELAVQLPCPEVRWREASALFRALRAKGFEASNMHVLIACIAKAEGVRLLTMDRHFETINRLTAGMIHLDLLAEGA